jgi:pyruvate dehydrogenase E2 component (dihydrolipoamide acetyltransferase)
LKEKGEVPTYNDMLVKASALALAEYLMANGSFAGDHFVLHYQVHVGIAVATEGSLVVPVITDADKKSLVEISTASRALAAKVRDGKIIPQELEGGTFIIMPKEGP